MKTQQNKLGKNMLNTVFINYVDDNFKFKVLV